MKAQEIWRPAADFCKASESKPFFSFLEPLLTKAKRPDFKPSRARCFTAFQFQRRRPGSGLCEWKQQEGGTNVPQDGSVIKLDLVTP